MLEILRRVVKTIIELKREETDPHCLKEFERKLIEIQKFIDQRVETQAAEFYATACGQGFYNKGKK